MSSTEDIVNMPAYRRRRLRLGKLRGKYAKKETRSFSEEELLSFLRERRYRTRKALREGRKEGEPTDSHYQRVFGSWGEATRVAFGPEVSDTEAEKKLAGYMAEAVSKLGLWTFEKYLAARREGLKGVPSYYERMGLWVGLVPSAHAVMKSWGSWSNLLYAAKGLNLKKELDECVILMRRLGRVPGMEDCKHHGINLSKALSHYGSKKKLDSVLKRMLDEERKGS